MATKPKKAPVAAAAATPTPAAAPAPALQFVNLDLIVTDIQVRKEFDEEDLQELANSIKDMGMLQPVLLRRLDDGRFCVIAGERRVRAARLAGLAAVPALVGDVEAGKAMVMQLIENIQREDLTLAETAAGVRALFDQLGEQKKVAAALNKSASWVSKHLSVSLNLSWQAASLLNDGITDDLELIQTVDKLARMHHKWYPRGGKLLDQIKEGKAGRKEARELLQVFKDEDAAAKAEAKKAGPAKKAAKKQGQLQLQEPPKFEPDDALENIENWTNRGERSTAEILGEFDEEQAAAIVEYVRELYDDGLSRRTINHLELLRRIWHKSEELWQLYQAAAWILGITQTELTLENLVNEIHELNQ